MPVYEYRCEKGHTFEVLQRMTDPPITKCEVCGRSVQRVFHPPAVHFKGKGFYNTDYGTKNRQRELAAAGDKSSSKDGKSDSGKSDSSKSDSGGGSESTKKDKAETSSSSSTEKKSDKPKGDKKSKPASKPA
jgi:putative FmdB family regulatory protein